MGNNAPPKNTAASENSFLISMLLALKNAGGRAMIRSILVDTAEKKRMSGIKRFSFLTGKA